MEDEGARSNGAAEWPKPAIPNGVVVACVVVALLAVSALLWVLFQKTTGPGEIVNRYYQAAADGDCDAAYGLLSRGLQQANAHDSFCAGLQTAQLPADPKIESVTLVGPEGSAREAEVSVDTCGSTAVWKLERADDTWVITSLADSPCASASLTP